MNDKEFTNEIHMIVHSMRLISGYKPSNAEIKIGTLVREHFKNNCNDCKKISDKITNTPEKKSFFNKIGDVLNE